MFKHASNLILILTVAAGIQAASVSAQSSGAESLELANDVTPKFEEHECPFAGEGEFDAGVVSCGSVEVAEDRSQLDGRKIRLSVMKIAALPSVSSPQPLVSLSGGPGLPAVTLANAQRFAGPDGAKLRSVAELIFFDQRGVGYSEPAFCRAIPDAHQYGVRRSPDGEKLLWANLRKCVADARAEGVSIDAFSSSQNAFDVRDLRRALGYGTWNIMGVSYGTELGQAVLQVDEAGTRAAILDSIVPIFPNPQGGWANYAQAYRDALQSLEAICLGDADCASANSDFASRFTNAIRQFKDDPIVFEGLPPEVYRNGTAIFDDQLAAMFVLILLYDASLIDDAPAVLHVFETRDEAALRAYFEAGAVPIDDSFGTGMGLVTNCRGASIASAAQTEAYKAELPDHQRWADILDWSDDCAAVYKGMPDPLVTKFSSLVPTLVAAGVLDPVTPPSFAKALLNYLPNSTYVEFPYAGHVSLSSYLSGCGGDLVADFLSDPTKPLDTACAAQTPRPAFLGEFRKTRSALEFLQPVQAGSMPVGLLMLVGGLVIAFAALPIGLVARIFGVGGTAATGSRAKYVRILLWLAVITSLTAIGASLAILIEWATQHPLAVPIGVPHKIALAGWLGFVAALFALVGLAFAFRSEDEAIPRPTKLGSVFVTALTIATVVFLFSMGAGPF